jgi:hypothetical protein
MDETRSRRKERAKGGSRMPKSDLSAPALLQCLLSRRVPTDVVYPSLLRSLGFIPTFVPTAYAVGYILPLLRSGYGVRVDLFRGAGLEVWVNLSSGCGSTFSGVVEL